MLNISLKGIVSSPCHRCRSIKMANHGNLIIRLLKNDDENDEPYKLEVFKLTENQCYQKLYQEDLPVSEQNRYDVISAIHEEFLLIKRVKGNLYYVYHLNINSVKKLFEIAPARKLKLLDGCLFEFGYNKQIKITDLRTKKVNKLSNIDFMSFIQYSGEILLQTSIFDKQWQELYYSLPQLKRIQIYKPMRVNDKNYKFFTKRIQKSPCCMQIYNKKLSYKKQQASTQDDYYFEVKLFEIDNLMINKRLSYLRYNRNSKILRTFYRKVPKYYKLTPKYVIYVWNHSDNILCDITTGLKQVIQIRKIITVQDGIILEEKTGESLVYQVSENLADIQ